MRKMFNLLAGLVVFATVLAGGFIATGALATECSIVTTKIAPGAGDYEFVFDGIQDGFFQFTMADGGSAGAFFLNGDFVIITEKPQNGYKFGGITCDSQPGIIVTQIPNGWTILCVDGDQGAAVCDVTNIPFSNPIPTLSEWGMIAAAAGLGLVGVFYAIRRRKAQAV
jgi:hypothetical protein